MTGAYLDLAGVKPEAVAEIVIYLAGTNGSVHLGREHGQKDYRVRVGSVVPAVAEHVLFLARGE